jgi:hypothetical protein
MDPESVNLHHVGLLLDEAQQNTAGLLYRL